MRSDKALVSEVRRSMPVILFRCRGPAPIGNSAFKLVATNHPFRTSLVLTAVAAIHRVLTLRFLCSTSPNRNV